MELAWEVGGHLRSIEVYRLVEEEWGGLLDDLGFKRVPKRRASWYSEVPEERYLIVGVYVDRHGWDRFRGSDFVVEFELADRLLVGGPYERRGRLGESFDFQALEEVKDLTNGIIRRLPQPLASDLGMQDDDPDYAGYIKAYFTPVAEVYSGDLHFRYLTDADVRLWLRYLLPTLSPAVKEFRLRHGV